MNTYCRNCGNEVTKKNNTCSNCGEPIHPNIKNETFKTSNLPKKSNKHWYQIALLLLLACNIGTISFTKGYIDEQDNIEHDLIAQLQTDEPPKEDSSNYENKQDTQEKDFQEATINQGDEPTEKDEKETLTHQGEPSEEIDDQERSDMKIGNNLFQPGDVDIFIEDYFKDDENLTVHMTLPSYVESGSTSETEDFYFPVSNLYFETSDGERYRCDGVGAASGEEGIISSIDLDDDDPLYGPEVMYLDYYFEVDSESDLHDAKILLLSDDDEVIAETLID